MLKTINCGLPLRSHTYVPDFSWFSFHSVSCHVFHLYNVGANNTAFFISLLGIWASTSIGVYVKCCPSLSFPISSLIPFFFLSSSLSFNILFLYSLSLTFQISPPLYLSPKLYNFFMKNRFKPKSN